MKTGTDTKWIYDSEKNIMYTTETSFNIIIRNTLHYCPGLITLVSMLFEKPKPAYATIKK